MSPSLQCRNLEKKLKSFLHKVSMRAQAFSCISATYCLNIKHFTQLYSLSYPWVFILPINIQYASLSSRVLWMACFSVFESPLYGILEAFIMIKVVGHSLRAFGAHFFANENGLQCSFFVDTLLGYPVRWSNSKVCLLAIFTMRWRRRRRDNVGCSRLSCHLGLTVQILRLGNVS